MTTLTGKSAGSISRKFGNFKYLDGTGGLGHYTNLDEKIWNECSSDIDGLSNFILNHSSTPDMDDSAVDVISPGKERETTVLVRVNQRIFRDNILYVYNKKCCITGIGDNRLLTASHIKPWKKSEPDEQTDPCNGLCLNAFHDRAFDRGLITINEDYRIELSKKIDRLNIPDDAFDTYFSAYDNRRICLPAKIYCPKKEFIRYHNEFIFMKD